jgi:hypothetical protein
MKTESCSRRKEDLTIFRETTISGFAEVASGSFKKLGKKAIVASTTKQNRLIFYFTI